MVFPMIGSKDQTMVERVARAIHVARFKKPGQEYEPWEMDESDREYTTRLAKAAIDAILSTGDHAGLVERLQQLARQQADGTDFHKGRALTAEDTMYWKAATAILSLTARNKALVGTVHNAWLQWKAGEWTAEEALTALFDEIVCPPINHQDNRQKEGGE
jgi:hypothetical protein